MIGPTLFTITSASFGSKASWQNLIVNFRMVKAKCLGVRIFKSSYLRLPMLLRLEYLTVVWMVAGSNPTWAKTGKLTVHPGSGPSGQGR